MNFGAAEGYVPSPSVQQAKVGKNLGEVSYSPVSVQRNTREKQACDGAEIPKRK